MLLKIKNLKVSVKGTDNANSKQILKGINLDIPEGEIHTLMGQNGSGKSTLAQTLMGHPSYEITDGDILLNGKSILDLEPHERSLEGIFLSFQYPSEIPGVTISSYLRLIYNAHQKHKNAPTLPPATFRKLLKEKMDILEMKEDFMNRFLNEGFSGGEKKRMEMLQMLVLEPRLAILDELDSGLDIDAVKIVADAAKHLVEKNNMAVLIITHYTRVLKHIEADMVHVMKDGLIVKSGSKNLAHEIEETGYGK